MDTEITNGSRDRLRAMTREWPVIPVPWAAYSAAGGWHNDLRGLVSSSGYKTRINKGDPHECDVRRIEIQAI
jgi:hypothetical protein